MSVVKFKLKLTLVQILHFDNKPDIDIWQTRKTNDFLCVIYYIYCNQINTNAFGENIIHQICKKKQSYISQAHINRMWFFFRRCFHFQNVVLFRKVFSFSKFERFCELFFLFPKNTIVNKNL